jgi:HSP20 family molecular chaperone IbpA
MSLLNTLIPSLGRASAPAATEPASVGLKPVFDVSETPEAYRLTVRLPGVAKEGLELTADSGQFRVVGRRAWTQPEGWTAVHRETADAPYELVLAHDNVLNVDQIQAELADGVLRVTLPKTEALKPRKISVN